MTFPIVRRPGTVLQAKLVLLPEGLPITTFDAFPFIRQATDEQLRSLFLSDWRTTSQNDEVVRYMLEHERSPHLRTALAVMVLASKDGTKRDWYIDLSQDMVLWMMNHRPGLWNTLLLESGNQDTKTEE